MNLANHVTNLAASQAFAAQGFDQDKPYKWCRKNSDWKLCYSVDSGYLTTDGDFWPTNYFDEVICAYTADELAVQLATYTSLSGIYSHLQ